MQAAELEPDKKWPVKMQDWISRAIHERNESGREGLDTIKNADTLEKEFRDILEEARKEYEYEPPEEKTLKEAPEPKRFYLSCPKSACIL